MKTAQGKSTLIKVLSGFYSADPELPAEVEGTQLSNGSPSESAAAGLRFVHQNLGLIDEMTVLENLRLTSDLQRGALAATGFADDRERPAAPRPHRSQSRPQPRRWESSRRSSGPRWPSPGPSTTATGRLRLLVLDEPTAAMSPTEVDRLFEIIREIKSGGASVLYISHRIDEILRLADTATVLRDGRMRGRFATKQVSRSELINRILGIELEEWEQAAHPPDAGGSSVCLNATRISSRYLSQVAITVRRGEVLGVAGLDGSGRDQLAQVLGGAIPADVELTTAKGAISGKLTVASSRAAGIGLVLPNTHPGSLIGEFTVRENLCLPNAGATSRHGFISQRGSGRPPRPGSPAWTSVRGSRIRNCRS